MHDPLERVYPVILAGGAGTRFWPAGRRARPKQLLPIAGPRTMLAETLDRCTSLAPPERTWVVTNRVQAEATRRECAALPEGQVIAEPSMRNTAAAIGLAALHLRRRDPRAIMLVLPADHHIHPREAFASCFRAAARRAAQRPALLTVGIPPRGPATGYGYIECAEQVAEVDGHRIHRVASFKEKPDAATAVRFLAAGNFFWNAGTFVWGVDTLLEAFRRHLPVHAELLEEIDAHLGPGRPIPETLYERFESVPIDVGILEKAENVEMLPASFEWDDVGSWLALDRLHTRDAQGNVARGTHVGLDTHNCILFGGGEHLLATIGIEDLIVVHTPDATLICPKDRAEEVRELVRRIGERGLDRHL